MSVRKDAGDLPVEVAANSSPPLRPSLSEEEQRKVIPKENETTVETVFRLLRHKILKLAMTSGSADSSKQLALSYRPVCRAWRDMIHAICFETGVPLFEYPKNEMAREDVRPLISLATLLTSDSGVASSSPVLPPVSLKLNLISRADRPLDNLSLFSLLRKMDRMLLSLQLWMAYDSPEDMEGLDWSSLELENLKYVKFTWFHYDNFGGPNHFDRPWKPVQEIVKVATSLQTLVVWPPTLVIDSHMPETALPMSIECLEIHAIRSPPWLFELAPKLKNMRKLILGTGICPYSNQDSPAEKMSQLFRDFAKTLESLELNEERMDRERLEQVPAISILEPMPKLRFLKFVLKDWKIGELKSYKEIFPSLTDLEVRLSWDQLHFPASWYSSTCETLKRLCFYSEFWSGGGPPLPEEVLIGFSLNFPNLEELIIRWDKFEGNNWQGILCHGFPNLCKLKVIGLSVPSEGRNRLVAAVTGIPLEELQVVLQGEKELDEVISEYEDSPSLRDLGNLQELTLNVSGSDEDEDGQAFKVETDSSIMISSTFIRMRNLKLVELSSSFQLTEEQKQRAIEETGLVILKTCSSF